MQLHMHSMKYGNSFVKSAPPGRCRVFPLSLFGSRKRTNWLTSFFLYLFVRMWKFSRNRENTNLSTGGSVGWMGLVSRGWPLVIIASALFAPKHICRILPRKALWKCKLKTKIMQSGMGFCHPLLFAQELAIFCQLIKSGENYFRRMQQSREKVSELWRGQR